MTRNLFVKSRNLSAAITAAAFMFGQPAFAETGDNPHSETETNKTENVTSTKVETAETSTFWGRLKTGFADVPEESNQTERASDEHEEEHQTDLEETESETT